MRSRLERSVFVFGDRFCRHGFDNGLRGRLRESGSTAWSYAATSVASSIAAIAEEAHGGGGEAVEGAAIPPPVTRTSGTNLALPSDERGNDVDDGGGVGAERFDLGAIAASASEADRFDFGAFGGAGLANEFGFTGGFGDAGVGVVFLDVDADFGAREVGLHVGGAFGLLHLDALILRGASAS